MKLIFNERRSTSFHRRLCLHVIAVLLLLGRAVQQLLPGRGAALANIPVILLGVLSAMWCIERGIEVIS